MVLKLLTVMAEAADARLQHAAQEALMTSWQSQGSRGWLPRQSAPTGLLQVSCQPQASTHRVETARRALFVSPSQRGGWLAASSAQQQGLGAGSEHERQQWEALRQRERELEVEREWEEDSSLLSVATHQADSSPRTLLRSRSLVETSTGRAILHASRVCFTSGWAGKPVFADHDVEVVGGSQFFSAGTRTAEQLRTLYTVSSPGCRPATTQGITPQMVVEAPVVVAAEDQEAASNMLASNTWSPPPRGCTWVSLPHAKKASDHQVSCAVSPRATQVGMPSGTEAQQPTFFDLFRSGSNYDPLDGHMNTGSRHSLGIWDGNTLDESDPYSSDLNVRVEHAELEPALTPISISGVAELYMAASAAAVPDELCGPQAAPPHFVEYHQQRTQHQLADPPPHQSQAIVMTSSFYNPSSSSA